MACPIFVNAQAIIHFTGGSEGYTRGCGKKLPCLVSDTKAVCCFLLISPRPCRRSLDKHNTTQFLRRSQNIQIWNDLQKSLPLAQPRNLHSWIELWNQFHRSFVPEFHKSVLVLKVWPSLAWFVRQGWGALLFHLLITTYWVLIAGLPSCSATPVNPTELLHLQLGRTCSIASGEFGNKLVMSSIIVLLRIHALTVGPHDRTLPQRGRTVGRQLRW